MTPQMFEFNGHNVRFVMLDGNKYAVGKDAALAIGYKNPTKAVRDNVKLKYRKGGPNSDPPWWKARNDAN